MEEVENAIESEAAEWVVRLDAAPGDETLAAELEAWLSASSLHRGAYVRAQAAWQALDDLQSVAVKRAAVPRINRRHLLMAGGASAAAAIGGAWLMLPAPVLIETPIGEIRRVPLADGSLINVNTDTALNVSLAKDVREIVVHKGEAWFEVAKDQTRPFIVAIGPVRVRAVGTAFSVRRRDQGADVLVTEGTVEVWSVERKARKAVINAGYKTFVTDDAGPTKVVSASPEMQRVLAWRNGEIALGGETLAEAAEEFNRYNEQKLVIDSELADHRLNGWFRTNDPRAFAKAAAETIGAQVAFVDGEIILRKSPDHASHP